MIQMLREKMTDLNLDNHSQCSGDDWKTPTDVWSST
jgi:hypothetical protein